MTILAIIGLTILFLAACYITFMVWLAVAWVGWGEEAYYFTAGSATLWTIFFYLNPLTISIGVG